MYFNICYFTGYAVAIISIFILSFPIRLRVKTKLKLHNGTKLSGLKSVIMSAPNDRFNTIITKGILV